MTPLEKIEKLLLNDGKPSQDYIDYQLDYIVNEMIDRLLIPNFDSQKTNNDSFVNSSTYSSNIFDPSKEIEVSNNSLDIFAKEKDFDYVLAGLRKSLARYEPYVNFHPRSNPLEQKRKYKNEDEYVSMGFSFQLHISPSMKKTMFLQKKLDHDIAKKTEKQLTLKI